MYEKMVFFVDIEGMLVYKKDGCKHLLLTTASQVALELLLVQLEI